VEIFQFVLGMEIQARWRNLRTCFKRELDSQKNATSGESSRKRRKYVYFDQLLFLPHTEDRETQSNLNSLNDEKEANSLQEEEKERPRNVRKKKRTEISYEESLLQILRQKYTHSEVVENFSVAVS
jgi:hypothetical protein